VTASFRVVGSWLVGCALLVTAPGASAESRPFLKGPYLHALGSDRAEVRVELADPAPVVLEVTADGSDKPAKKVQSHASAFHALAVGGLEPQKKYAYVVRPAAGEADAAAGAARGTFTTAPKDDAPATFTFLVYGDNRTDHAAHAAVVRAMKSEPSDFLIHTGDFVSDGSSADDWQRFFDIEGELLRDRCVFACVGNHELYDHAGALFLRFVGPGAQVGDEKPRLYGSVRWGSARFFFLNFMTDDREGEKAWLNDELTRADKEPGLAWRVAVMHHGPFASGPHGSNKRLHDMGVVTMLREHNVDLVLSGHDHIYERGLAERLRYMVSGGGGAPPYEIKAPIAGSRKSEAARHYVSITVTKDTVKTTAKRVDGTALDICSFNATSGDWDCDTKAGVVTSAAAPPPKSQAVPSPPPSRCSCREAGAPAPGAVGWGAVLGAIAAAGAVGVRRRRP
jgi:predicted phosphodiesterase